MCYDQPGLQSWALYQDKMKMSKKDWNDGSLINKAQFPTYMSTGHP